MDFWRSSLKVKLSEYIDASRDKIAIYKISDINNMIVSSARAVAHITEPHKIVVALIGIHIVVDCYESDIVI